MGILTRIFCRGGITSCICPFVLAILCQRFREVNFLERLVLFGQQFFCQLVIVAGDQVHMSYAVVLQLSDDAGLLRACQHCDGSRLLRLFIFCGLLGIVHIDAIRIRDGKDLDKTQFGNFLRSLQEVIDADNIIALGLSDSPEASVFTVREIATLPEGMSLSATSEEIGTLLTLLVRI